MYVIIILVCMAIISVANIFFNISAFDNSIMKVVGIVIIAVIIEILVDLLLAWIIHSLNDKHFGSDKKIFVVSDKERKFYEKLKIRAWKDKVIELGALGVGGFRKNKIKDKNDLNYISRFLLESNKGIIVHIANIIGGFLIMLIPPFKWSFCVALPVSIVNAFLGLLPLFVLRYNIPKLLIVKKRIERTNVTSIQ